MIARYGLFLALLLGLALRLPGWFTDDTKARFQLFEPDEIQHVDIALDRFQQLSGDSLAHSFTEIFNVRGYGITAGHLAYGQYILSGKPPDIGRVVLLNRQLASGFGLLTILLVFFLARGFGLSPYYAAIAALLLAFCDLHSTYSHYGLPAMGYVFGLYLSMFGAQKIQARAPWAACWMALGAAIAFAFKFDFFPALLGGGLLGIGLWKGYGNAEGVKGYFLYQGLLFLLAFGLFFGILTGFSWPLDNIVASWKILRAANENVIAQDQHWRDNPLVYTAAIVAGIGLPATWMALRGAWQIRWPKPLSRPAVWYVAALLVLEILLRWRIDTPFVRRANEFMPALCLLAAYGFYRLQSAPWKIAAVLAYTFAFALVGQSNHWWDTRVDARNYVLSELPDTAKIEATPYMAVNGLPNYPRFQSSSTWEYALLHESYYQRYTRSLTTPFGFPDCCEGVYHCHSVEECTAIQALLKGNNQAVEQIAHFQTTSVFPERILYKKLFGTYETFLGDVLVFARKKQE